jgi:ABC-type Fe3+ transport system substrate-binding protein
VTALAIVASGCGDDDDAGTATTTTTASTAGSEPAGGEGAAWEQVVTTANEQGTVVVYSSLAPAVLETLEGAFEEAYPDIDAQVTRRLAPDTVQAVDQERAAGRQAVDVVVTSDPVWEAGQLEDGFLVPPTGPATAEWDPANYENGVVRLNGNPFGVLYNTNEVDPTTVDSPDEQTWDALATGGSRIAMAEVAGVVAASVYRFFRDDAGGGGFLDALADEEVQIFAGQVPTTQAVGAGEAMWTPYSYASTYQDLLAAGAPVGYFIPPSETFVVLQNGMIMEDAVRPEAAQVFLDFLMTPEAQELMNGNGRGFSYLEGIEGAIELDPEAVIFNSDVEHPDTLIDEMRAELDRVFR